jgi:AraC-like DNA-binding protein
LITVFETALNALYEKDRNEVSSAIAINALNYIITSVSQRFLLSHESTNNISLQESLLVYIMRYLKNNIYKIDALKDLSEDTGYSYPYLSHLFSQKMGQSLKSFFTVLRMNTATELLRKKRVTEVAEILGYSSIHSFSRAYKKFCDETPCNAKDKLEDNDITKYI